MNRGTKHNYSWVRRILAGALFLVACAGGPGAGPGGGVGGDGKGNYASGPMPIPAPATLNKDLIYCRNVEGPKVDCYGRPHAVDPNAKVTVTVHESSFTQRSPVRDFFIPSAYATPGSTATGDADGTGAFGPISVTASPGEVLEIKSCIPAGCSLRLLLTVGAEGTTSSGSTGTMKNLEFDPGSGDAFHSRLWDWLVPSAAAADVPNLIGSGLIQVPIGGFRIQVSAFPTVNAKCDAQPVNWTALPKAYDTEPACHVMRVKAAQPDVSEQYLGIPTCEHQEDINVIRVFKDKAANKTHLAVGVGPWLYLIKVETANGAPEVVRRIAFPYQVNDVRPIEGHLLVVLGGEGIPSSANKFYTLHNDPADWATECWGTSLGGVLDGLEKIVSSDGTADSFIFAASYQSGASRVNKVVHVGFTDWDLIDTNWDVIATSPSELEVANFGVVGTKITYFILNKTEKKLIRINYSRVYGQRLPTLDVKEFPLSAMRTADGTFEANDMRHFVINRDRKELAFIDVKPDYVSSRLVVIPLQADSSGSWAPSQVAGTISLDFIPTVLKRGDTERQRGWAVNRPDNQIDRIQPTTERFEAWEEE